MTATWDDLVATWDDLVHTWDEGTAGDVDGIRIELISFSNDQRVGFRNDQRVTYRGD